MDSAAMARGRGAALLVLSVLFIASVTLVPGRGGKPEVDLACILCGEYGGPDLVLNVILFMPFGIALGRRGVRPLVALGLALAVSGTVEAVQYVLPGRSSTLRDVLTNALGGGLGAVIVHQLPRWVAPGPRTIRLLWGAVIASLTAVAATGWLLRPAPPAGPYYAQWVPHPEHLAPWTGAVRAAAIDGDAVPAGLVRDAEALRAAIAAGRPVRVMLLEGAATRHLAGIFQLTDARTHEVLLVGAIGDELEFRSRRRAAMFRLKAPDVRFPGALSGRQGAPLTVSLRGDLLDGVCLEQGADVRCAPLPAAGSTWALFLSMPDRVLPRRILEFLTFLTLAFPVGLFAGSAPARHAWAAVTAAAFGVTGIAVASSLAWPSWWEALGFVAGLAVARTLHRRLRRAAGCPAPSAG